MRWLTIPALVLVVSGCLATEPGDKEPVGANCSSPTALWAPVGGDAAPIEVDGVQRSDILVVFPNSSSARLANLTLPERWTAQQEAIGPANDAATFLRVGITSAGLPATSSRDPNARTPLRDAVRIGWTGGCTAASGENEWRTVYAHGGKTVVPGDGVHVFYAGFWLNGTIFSTNIASIDASAWPRGGWYTSPSGAPLNVYVYDRDRSERPPQWAPTDPTTNQPAKWSYATTIQGFNAALKGLSLGSSRVVVIPPEQAYTQPGRESHALFGDALVFYIDVVEIVDVPCPPEVPNRALCRTPA